MVPPSLSISRLGDTELVTYLDPRLFSVDFQSKSLFGGITRVRFFVECIDEDFQLLFCEFGAAASTLCGHGLCGKIRRKH